MKKNLIRAAEVATGLGMFLVVILALCILPPEQRGGILTVFSSIAGISIGCLWIWFGLHERVSDTTKT